jgi:dehydrogenase/reductase SDR family member 1
MTVMTLKKALVTGGSRGVGRGVAIALDQAGYQVFATGRTIDRAQLPGSITGIRCDHLRDEETASAFAQAGDLDVQVNSAWGGYERMLESGKFTWPAPFWEQPLYRWSSMMDAGVRALFVASQHAARVMIPRGNGLIVNISFWAAQKYLGNTLYGASKAATDKLTFDMAQELRPHGIAVVSLYPGLVRTELVLEAAQWLDLSNSESPEFIGRVIAALARDPRLMERSGQVVVAAQAALELGVTDIDGKQPLPLKIEQV